MEPNSLINNVFSPRFVLSLLLCFYLKHLLPRGTVTKSQIQIFFSTEFFHNFHRLSSRLSPPKKDSTSELSKIAMEVDQEVC